VLIFGVLLLFGSAGCGVMLALENRDVVVRAEVAGAAWTGHLYTAVIVGALLVHAGSCWARRSSCAGSPEGAAVPSRDLQR